MEEKSKRDLDTRLKTVAYMRASAAQSRRRLERAEQILANPNDMLSDYYGYEAEASEAATSGQTETGITAGASFLLRLGFVLLLFVGFYFGKQGPDGRINLLLQSCKREIAVDYSENLFDFIEQIPYTFDYEKANVTGRDPIAN